uniref:Transthyretin-like family protein n=1 Tax=Panagrellus redivivus TaxID=6233 RepID=A0A7E4WBH0_PANRE
MKSLIAVVFTALIVGCAAIGREQASGARGRLLCNGKPAANVLVKLWDEDDYFGSDDLLDEGVTDSDGFFELAGHVTEITPIDPKLNIYHDCEDYIPCQRKVTIKIPNKYITPGMHPQRYYEAGTIELEGEFVGESRDCLH